ncbi:hypothetical protein M072_3868 [Bacteroides fragilis str. DS-208]|nr:hypothetical protein M072_3868 [Bacteroides fragilis str. DS-208]
MLGKRSNKVINNFLNIKHNQTNIFQEKTVTASIITLTF